MPDASDGSSQEGLEGRKVRRVDCRTPVRPVASKEAAEAGCPRPGKTPAGGRCRPASVGGRQPKAGAGFRAARRTRRDGPHPCIACAACHSGRRGWERHFGGRNTATSQSGWGCKSLARRGSEGSSDRSDARVGLEVRAVGLRCPPRQRDPVTRSSG